MAMASIASRVSESLTISMAESSSTPTRYIQPPSASPDPKVVKCFKDLATEKACTGQIIISFFTRKLEIEPECCQDVNDISEDCVAPIFAYFQNPFFGFFFKGYCSRHAVAPPSQPPSPASSQNSEY